MILGFNSGPVHLCLHFLLYTNFVEICHKGSCCGEPSPGGTRGRRGSDCCSLIRKSMPCTDITEQNGGGWFRSSEAIQPEICCLAFYFLFCTLVWDAVSNNCFSPFPWVTYTLGSLHRGTVVMHPIYLWILVEPEVPVVGWELLLFITHCYKTVLQVDGAVCVGCMQHYRHPPAPWWRSFSYGWEKQTAFMSSPLQITLA